MPKPKGELAMRQEEMKKRSIPQPTLTRVAALNQLAAQIERLPDGSEKIALLSRYLSLKGRRRVITRAKRTSQPEPMASSITGQFAVDYWRKIRNEEIARTGNSTIPDDVDELESYPVPPYSVSCCRCRNQYEWVNAAGEIVADPQTCSPCEIKWQEENKRLIEEQKRQPLPPVLVCQPSIVITEER